MFFARAFACASLIAASTSDSVVALLMVKKTAANEQLQQLQRELADLETQAERVQGETEGLEVEKRYLQSQLAIVAIEYDLSGKYQNGIMDILHEKTTEADYLRVLEKKVAKGAWATAEKLKRAVATAKELFAKLSECEQAIDQNKGLQEALKTLRDVNYAEQQKIEKKMNPNGEKPYHAKELDLKKANETFFQESTVDESVQR